MTSKRYCGRRGANGTQGRWISLEEATKSCATKEEWWRTELVAAVQHDPKGPSNRPIWLYENDDMYLGQWRAKGENGYPVEHGKGVTYNGYPDEKVGLMYKGDWRNGYCHGHAESYWLESCDTWLTNYLEGSEIERPDEITGHQCGAPYCYKGNYKNDSKNDPKAVVTLHDGSTRVGPWRNGKPGGDWFHHPSAAMPPVATKRKAVADKAAQVAAPGHRDDSSDSDNEEAWVPEDTSAAKRLSTSDNDKEDKMVTSKKRKQAPAKVAPNRKRRSNPDRAASAAQPEPHNNGKRPPIVICLDDTSDDEKEKVEANQKETANEATKEEVESEDNQKEGETTTRRDERSVRVQQIATYLTQDVIANNPNPSTMRRYAERLHDKGFESVEMIEAYLKRRHLEAFDWMLPLHKEIILQKVSRVTGVSGPEGANEEKEGWG